MTNTFEPRHTPFPWRRFEDGGTLVGSDLITGWKYGPQSADWVWGPRGPGHGVVADCSPSNPCTTESLANARLIETIPDLIALAELASVNGPPELQAVAEIVLRKAGRIA